MKIIDSEIINTEISINLLIIGYKKTLLINRIIIEI